MTERQLISLGFEKTTQEAENYTDKEGVPQVEPEYWYYTLKLSGIDFTSSSSDVSGKSRYTVTMEQNMPDEYVEFTKINHLRKVLELMRSNMTTFDASRYSK